MVAVDVCVSDEIMRNDPIPSRIRRRIAPYRIVRFGEVMMQFGKR